jgi:hypothetical protein
MLPVLISNVLSEVVFEYVFGDAGPGIVSLCRRGRLEKLLELDEVFGRLTPASVRASNNRAFRWACQRGHLELARWLAARFALTSADARALNDSAFVQACAKGHLKLAGWLVDSFGVTGATVVSNEYYLLRHSCETGRTKVADWLITKFSLELPEVQKNVIQSMMHPLLHGAIALVRWLEARTGRAVRVIYLPTPVYAFVEPPQIRNTGP